MGVVTGKIFEYSKVIDIKRDKAGYIAKTSSGGIIKAKKVVIATGGYFSNIGTSFLSEKLFSLKTSIGVTEPLNANLSGTISSNVAIHDDRRAGNYFRFLPDNRLLWGRDIRAIGIPNKKKIIRDTKRDLKYFFPKQKKFFDKMRVDYSWSGKLGYSSNLMPYISAEKSGLYLLTGFGGHGMNTAPAAANIVKEAILGDKSKMQTFKEFSPKWNGGFLGKYAAEIYLRYLKIRDQIDRI